MHCIIRGLISFNFLLYYLLNHCNLIQYSFRQFYQIFFFILCKLTPASIQHFTVNAIAAYCIYTKNYPLVRDGNCAMIYLTLFRATMNNSGQIWAYFGASHYSYLFIQTRPGQSEHGSRKRITECMFNRIKTYPGRHVAFMNGQRPILVSTLQRYCFCVNSHFV